MENGTSTRRLRSLLGDRHPDKPREAELCDNHTLEIERLPNHLYSIHHSSFIIQIKKPAAPIFDESVCHSGYLPPGSAFLSKEAWLPPG